MPAYTISWNIPPPTPGQGYQIPKGKYQKAGLKVVTKRAESVSDALSHHSFSPAEASGLGLAEGTAPGAHWSQPRSEGSGPGPVSWPLAWCQDLAPPLSVGAALPR